MKALSLTQPWGWLIVNFPGEFWKDVENRRWNTNFRGEFLVHAAKKCTEDDYESAVSWVWKNVGIAVAQQIPPLADLLRGGIIGAAKLVGVRRPWSLPTVGGRPSWHMPEQYGFELRDRRALSFVPCRGALGFWTVPPDVLRQVQL